MNKRALIATNTELVELLTMLRDLIDAQLEEIDAVEDDDEEPDDEILEDEEPED